MSLHFHFYQGDGSRLILYIVFLQFQYHMEIKGLKFCKIAYLIMIADSSLEVPLIDLETSETVIHAKTNSKKQ